MWKIGDEPSFSPSQSHQHQFNLQILCIFKTSCNFICSCPIRYFRHIQTDRLAKPCTPELSPHLQSPHPSQGDRRTDMFLRRFSKQLYFQVVSHAWWLGTERPINRGSIRGRDKTGFSPSKCPQQPWRAPSLPFDGCQSPFPGDKAMEMRKRPLTST